MILIPIFPPTGPVVRNVIQMSQDSVDIAHTMENPSNDPRETNEPAPPRRSWRDRVQKALARVTKFFRRGRRSTQG